MQLIVLGMHRSGTSVLARLLNLMGAYFGPEGISTGANKENPKGFWERRDVRDLNDAVLHGVGCDWNRVLGFHAPDLPGAIVSDFDKQAAKVLLDMDAHRPWLLKEPRLCLLLPLWRRLLEAPVSIHIHRNPVEVASSLNKRNGIPMRAGLALWEKYVLSAWEASTDLPRVLVSHRQLITEPVETVACLRDQLVEAGVQGLRLPARREVEAFISADLYRERESRGDLLEYAQAPQMQIYHRLASGMSPVAGTYGGLSEEDRKALADYESSLPAIKPAPGKATIAQEQALRGQLALKEQETRLVREANKQLAADIKRRDEQAAALADKQQAYRITALQREVYELQRLAERHKNERFGETAQLTRRLIAEEQAAASLGVEKEELSARLDRMGVEKTALSARLDSLVAVHQAAAAASTRKISELQAQLAQLKEKAAARDSEVERLQALVSGKQARIGELERRIAGLTGSLAWRISAPLRFVPRPIDSRHRKAASLPLDDAALIRESAWFDAAWYLARNPDVADGLLDPAQHYLDHGAAEGRNPGPNFDTRRYLAAYPDVAASGLNPLLHYLRHGQSEGRAAKADGEH